MAQGVLHKRSSVLDKKPTAEQLEVGEISVNYAEGDGSSFLAIKKSDDTIATFHEDDYFVNIIENTVGDISSILKDVLYNA